ncbi:hypothetical protein [Streptomyces sp. NPDC001269]
MSTKPSTAAALHGWDELLSDPPADLAPAARDRLPQLAEREVSRTKRVCPLPTPQRRARAVLLQEHGAGGVRSRRGAQDGRLRASHRWQGPAGRRPAPVSSRANRNGHTVR